MRVKYYVLSIMGLFLFAVLPLIHNTYFISQVSADDSATSSASILNQILQESASKAAQIKNVVSQKLNNKEYSGVVSAKTSVSYTLDSDGNQLTVLTDKYTDTSSQVKGSSKISDDDYIVALGDLNDNNELVAKKIIKINPPEDATPSAVWGKAKAVGPTGVTVIKKDNKSVNINVTGDTNYQLGKDDGSLADILAGSYIVAMGDFDKNRELSAKFIYIIPAKNQTPKTKVASPSASKSPSPSASPKKK